MLILILKRGDVGYYSQSTLANITYTLPSLQYRPILPRTRMTTPRLKTLCTASYQTFLSHISHPYTPITNRCFPRHLGNFLPRTRIAVHAALYIPAAATALYHSAFSLSRILHILATVERVQSARDSRDRHEELNERRG